jgi:hypothetical protein
MGMRWDDPDDGTPLWQHVLLTVAVIAIFIAWTGVRP